jgi:quinol monooxygenase YgiN
VPQAQDQSDTIMLYEVYTSLEAFEVHRNGPFFQQHKEEAGALIASLSGVRCDLAE